MKSLTTQAENIAKQKYLSVLLTEEKAAWLPVEQMAEIINLETNKILPIPDLDPKVIGAFNWRQKVIWLIDLPALLDYNPIKIQKRNSLSLDAIVIKDRERRIGIAVLEIKDILSKKTDNKQANILNSKEIFKLTSR